MVLIKVNEPFARAPRLGVRRQPPSWDGHLESSRGFADVVGSTLVNTTLGLSEIERLELEDCELDTTVLDDVDEHLEISLAASTIERCDLSRLRITVARQCRLVGVKLAGTDFAGLVRDVEFEDCMLRLTSFRMAELERVTFINCTFEDVDAYSAGLTDVSFPESRLNDVNLDQTRATRVDLRDAKIEGLKGLSNLAGYLIADHQLPALAYQLADAVGLGVEAADA